MSEANKPIFTTETYRVNHPFDRSLLKPILTSPTNLEYRIPVNPSGESARQQNPFIEIDPLDHPVETSSPTLLIGRAGAWEVRIESEDPDTYYDIVKARQVLGGVSVAGEVSSQVENKKIA